MAQAWVDTGARGAALVPLALQGLRHRVVRPVAAAGVEFGAARPGHDVAIGGRPRRVLVAVVAAVAAVLVGVAQLGLTWAVAASAGTAGRDRVGVALVGVWDGLLVALLVGAPLAVGVWGERRTRSRQRRDSGIGLVIGAAVAVLLVFVVPAALSGVAS